MKKEAFNTGWTIRCGEVSHPVLLPHDAMLETGRSPDAPSGSGCAHFLGELYEYTKVFTAPEDWAGRCVIAEFEGVYPKAEVRLNGKEIARGTYGYGLFRAELKDLIIGEENTISVTVDNRETPNTRWYSGAGIHRPVWLLTGEKDHILPDGVKVITESVDPAVIRVKTAYAGEDCTVRIQILRDHRTVAVGEGADIRITVPDAQLWDDIHPNLYVCHADLIRDGRVTDSWETTFGIRKLEWSVKGFFVNGRSVKLKGGCMHNDNGVLGSRSFDEADYRRIRTLKDWGFNAFRSSHNPASRALLEACDELGIYVMDEAWDMWYTHKTAHDHAEAFPENYRDELKAMIDRDLNHPSVCLYSIGNEVSEPAAEKGVQTARELIDLIHGWDPTRPVTAGINLMILLMTAGKDNGFDPGVFGAPLEMDSTKYNEMVSSMGAMMPKLSATNECDRVTSPVLDLLDIAGYNYASSRYPLEPEKHPSRILVGSETFMQDLWDNWSMVEKYPYLIGDFMWTAWDYLGEAGLGAWSYEADAGKFGKDYPWLLADSGAFDILGNPTGEAGRIRAVWNPGAVPFIGVVPVDKDPADLKKAIWRGTNIIPTWSWTGCEGRNAVIEVYTPADSVELFLNGVSLGCRKAEKTLARFETAWTPGTLRAVAYNQDGTVHSESSLTSAGDEVRIALKPELPRFRNGLLYVDVSLEDESGHIHALRDTLLKAEVTGGTLLGFGSANPRTEESFLTGEYSTWYGKALAVILPGDGPVTLTVTAAKDPSVRPATLEIRI